MKTWYNKIDEGEVASKKELIKDFYGYFIFAIISLVGLLLSVIISIGNYSFIGIAIFFAYYSLSNENNMRAIKQYYREIYSKKKELK